MSADNSIDSVPIGKSQGRKTKAMSFLDKLIGVACPFQKREIALAPEGDIKHGSTPLTHRHPTVQNVPIVQDV
jgi:hypothetical protein